MIVNIEHKGLADLCWKDLSKGVMQSHVKRLKQILSSLDDAQTVDDMNLPGLRLHALKGNMNGFYAVSVSGNWRVTFRFADGNAYDVNLVDYH
jgi:proteic killer suppression protein